MALVTGIVRVRDPSRALGLARVTARPVAAYSLVTVLAASGYIWLERELILAESTESRI